MSLTATLLFGNPITLPSGTRRPPHLAGLAEPNPVSAANYKKRLAQREANIERVLLAIRQGADTTIAIAKHTGLSKSTVLKAVNRLNDRGHILRTIRKNKITKPTHHWRATLHNNRVEGRDAASSRRVPSHDGLCGNGSEVGVGDTAMKGKQ